MTSSATQRFARLARLARKELRETLRDRRTILTLVLMPLLVYPLLGLTFRSFLVSQAATLGGQGRSLYVLAFDSGEQAERSLAFLNLADQLPEFRNAKRPDEPEFKGTWPDGDREWDAEQLVIQGEADVALRVADATADGPAAVELFYDPRSPVGRTVRFEVERRLRAADEVRLSARLREAGIDVEPIRFEPRPVAVTGGGPAMTLAAVLPLVLLLMTVTGAVYPAIDLTAGERERGTLEALVAAPVSRRTVLLAKYVAVLTVALLTAGMNLVAMTATAFALGLDGLLFAGIRPIAVLQVVALVLVLATFFSAVLLLVTSFARSFKEAQAYLIPLMLVSLAPGIVSLTPDLPTTPLLAVTPLVGVVLVGRDLLTGGADPVLAAACVTATLAYAAVALTLAARAFGTDAVLYGSAGTWAELVRRPAARRAVPSPAVAVGCLAAVVPAFVLLGGLPGRFPNLSLAGRLGISAGLTTLLFLGIPAAAAGVTRSDLRTTFRLTRPKVAAVVGAALLGVSLWPFAYELELAVLSQERVDRLKETFASLGIDFAAVPLPLLWLTLAVVPAFCEEWFFRGLFLSALRTRLRAWAAVSLSAVAFGAMHVLVRDSLLPERIVPSAALGLALGTVCVRSGSLWPGVLLHAIHNGLLLTLAAYQKELAAAGWGGGEGTHLPAVWLAAAGGGVVVGAGLVAIGRGAERV